MTGKPSQETWLSSNDYGERCNSRVVRKFLNPGVECEPPVRAEGVNENILRIYYSSVYVGGNPLTAQRYLLVLHLRQPGRRKNNV